MRLLFIVDSQIGLVSPSQFEVNTSVCASCRLSIHTIGAECRFKMEVYLGPGMALETKKTDNNSIAVEQTSK